MGKSKKIGFREILEELNIIEESGEIPGAVTGITQNSRLVEKGFVFAARSGQKTSGMTYIQDAIDRGASVVVTSEPIPTGIKIPVVRVSDFRKALVHLSHAIYRNPSERVKLIGITGTNGKTSSTYLIRAILKAAGETCGLIGTIGYDNCKSRIDASLTTPDIDQICALLSHAADEGCKWVVIEVSSHALALGRIVGLRFVAAGFTNLSREHIDFHKSISAYGATKAKLFQQLPAEGIAVVNNGDPWGKVMADAADCKVITYGAPGVEADLNVEVIDQQLSGGRFKLRYGKESFEVETPLIGAYQGQNIALCAGLAFGLGFTKEAVIHGVAGMSAVEGRMEKVRAGQSFTVLADYSHTPDALQNAINSLRPLCKGRIIVVFGCGGNRDRTKRPIMGRITSQLADRIIVTSDNPRDESPEVIISEIIAGISPDKRMFTNVIIDRREAIRKAVSIAQDIDIVLIAGKGHETCQEILGEKRPFDDRRIAVEELAKIGWKLHKEEVGV